MPEGEADGRFFGPNFADRDIAICDPLVLTGENAESFESESLAYEVGPSTIYQCPKSPGRVLLHAGQNVRVNPEGDFNSLVSKALLDYVRRNSSLERRRNPVFLSPCIVIGLTLAAFRMRCKLALPRGCSTGAANRANPRGHAGQPVPWRRR